jgi:hypothetical protein
MILYHEYIVDHFTTTLSAMLEKYLTSRLKQILSPLSASFYDHFPETEKT